MLEQKYLRALSLEEVRPSVPKLESLIVGRLIAESGFPLPASVRHNNLDHKQVLISAFSVFFAEYFSQRPIEQCFGNIRDYLRHLEIGGSLMQRLNTEKADIFDAVCKPMETEDVFSLSLGGLVFDGLITFSPPLFKGFVEHFQFLVYIFERVP